MEIFRKIVLLIDISSGSIQDKLFQAIRKYERKNQRRFTAVLHEDENLSNQQLKSVIPVERSKVPAPELQHNDSKEQITILISNHLEKILGVQKGIVNLEKSFQDYGLDSITAAQLSAALEKDFNMTVPPNWLVEYSTVSLLTEKLSKSKKVLEVV